MKESLVFDFRLWATASAETQIEHIKFLHHYITNSDTLVKEKYGVGFFLDILETFFWLSPPDFIPPDLLARLMVARGPENRLASAMRSAILAILRDLTLGKPKPEDINRILCSLWAQQNDQYHIYELLCFIVEQCRENSEFNGVLTAHPFLSEILIWSATNSELEKCRVQALKLMLLIIKVYL
jgi:hypothetical protein